MKAMLEARIVAAKIHFPAWGRPGPETGWARKSASSHGCRSEIDIGKMAGRAGLIHPSFCGKIVQSNRLV
jgi:hypothetical protein